MLRASLPFAGVGGPGRLSKSVAVFERGFGFLQIKIPLGVCERLGFFCQTRVICAAFSSKRHARQQIVQPFGDGQRGISFL